MAEDSREIPVVGIAHPLADRSGGTDGDTWVATESRAPVVFLSASRVNLLATAAREGRRVVLVTDENSVLTTAFATVWRQAGGSWAVREAGGRLRNGFDGRRLVAVEDAGRLPPPAGVDEVSVNYLRPVTADAWQLTAFASTRHPARDSTVLGTLLAGLADAGHGAPPRLWGTHEPLALPWDERALTQTVRERMPDETAVFASGPGVAGVVSAQRTQHGVEEMTQAQLALTRPGRHELDRVRSSLSAVLQRSAETSMPLVALLLARPGRADLLVRPFLTAPQVPFALLVGAPAVRSSGLDLKEMRTRFGAQLVGRPRIPALLFDLGEDGLAAWRRLDDILGALDPVLLHQLLGRSAEEFRSFAEDRNRPPESADPASGGGADAQP